MMYYSYYDEARLTNETQLQHVIIVVTELISKSKLMQKLLLLVIS